MVSQRKTYSRTLGGVLLAAAAVAPWMIACGDDTSKTDGADAGITPTPTPTTTGTGTGTTPIPPPATCTDAKKDGAESDVDCGGTSCAKCAVGKTCGAAGDCTSGVCTGKICAAPSCTDTVKNGPETDVDCGATCGTCGDGKGCAAAADCSSGLCGPAKVCLAASCGDTIKNGTESDVDCGGTCAKCVDLKTCAAGTDCASGVCDAVAHTCTAPACNDTVKNGTETDADCGGTCATKCADTKTCAVPADCASGVCNAVAHTCTAPACDDTIKNGTETDTDCGGSCTTKCATGKACAVSSDCDKGVCAGLSCRLPTSCKDRKDAVAGSADGIYVIDPDGAGANAPYSVYCDMTNDGGGWTLALKADGALATFGYDAAVWTDTTSFGTAAFDATEAKLQSFNDLGFTSVRVGLVTGGVTNTAVIPQASTSLQALFAGGFTATALTRATWKALIPGSGLQASCDHEGFNSITAPLAWSRVRIGILGNEQNDCGSPDSWLGIGGAGTPCQGGTQTVGNLGGCGTDNVGGGGAVSIVSFGYVFVR